LFRKESGEGSAAYQDQLLEATALLLRTRDVRAKSADLENKGIGVNGFFRLLCRALLYYKYILTHPFSFHIPSPSWSILEFFTVWSCYFFNPRTQGIFGFN
jgi:hypothetical protein